MTSFQYETYLTKTRSAVYLFRPLYILNSLVLAKLTIYLAKQIGHIRLLHIPSSEAQIPISLFLNLTSVIDILYIMIEIALTF